jgi:hypothetical protein
MSSFTGGFAQVTVDDTAVYIGSQADEFDVPSEDEANHCEVFVGDQPIRIRYDGGDPEAGMGHLIPADSSFTLTGASNVRNLKAIADTSATGAAVANVTLEIV